MKAKNILLFAFVVLIFSYAANAQRGVRIGYIDMEYILESVPEYKESETQLEGKVQRWKADIEKKQKAIDQMKLNLANERVLLTVELIEEREEEIQILEEEMIKYQQDQVFNIVQEIAVNKKYDFIFDKSADVVMLFAAERNDISDQVVRSINRSNTRKEAPNRRNNVLSGAWFAQLEVHLQ